jgi:hypothetical protein
MFKRLFWLTVGTALGFGGSVWAQRRLRQKIEQYYPERVAQQVSTSVRTLSADVLAAAKEGRAAMQERELALRARIRPPAQ